MAQEEKPSAHREERPSVGRARVERLPGVVVKWKASDGGAEILGTAMCPHAAGQEQPDCVSPLEVEKI